MSSWIKHFSDGDREIGSDKDISDGIASWSKGKLDNINGVTLLGPKNTTIRISNTEWHHFDRYIALLEYGSSNSVRVARVVQAKINESHLGKDILHCMWSTDNNGIDFFAESILIGDSFTIPSSFNTHVVSKIDSSDLGKWVTLIWKEDRAVSKIGFYGKGMML